MANVFGINPEQEKLVTNIHQQIIEGDYFESQKKSILISKAQAEKYNIGLKKKSFFHLQINLEHPQNPFRVCGIYDTKNQLLTNSMYLFDKRSQ